MSHKINGNQHVAKNGDLIYKENGVIVRKNTDTGKISPISQEELKRFGNEKGPLSNPQDHPDVHIPVEDFKNKFGKKDG